MFRKLGIAMVGAAVLAVVSGTMVKAETPAAPAQRQEEEKAAEKKLTDINKSMDELAGEIKKAEGKTQAELNRLYEYDYSLFSWLTDMAADTQKLKAAANANDKAAIKDNVEALAARIEAFEASFKDRMTAITGMGV